MKDTTECPCFCCCHRTEINCICDIDPIKETPKCAGCEREAECLTNQFKIDMEV